jgi:hypothetical protein
MFGLVTPPRRVLMHVSRWRPDHPIACGDYHRTLKFYYSRIRVLGQPGCAVGSSSTFRPVNCRTWSDCNHDKSKKQQAMKEPTQDAHR